MQGVGYDVIPVILVDGFGLGVTLVNATRHEATTQRWHDSLLGAALADAVGALNLGEGCKVLFEGLWHPFRA